MGRDCAVLPHTEVQNIVNQSGIELAVATKFFLFVTPLEFPTPTVLTGSSSTVAPTCTAQQSPGAQVQWPPELNRPKHSWIEDKGSDRRDWKLLQAGANE